MLNKAMIKESKTGNHWHFLRYFKLPSREASKVLRLTFTRKTWPHWPAIFIWACLVSHSVLERDREREKESEREREKLQSSWPSWMLTPEEAAGAAISSGQCTWLPVLPSSFRTRVQFKLWLCHSPIEVYRNNAQYSKVCRTQHPSFCTTSYV